MEPVSFSKAAFVMMFVTVIVWLIDEYRNGDQIN
jgi:hypothetical protein